MEATELRGLLERLSNEIGVAGRERAVRNLVREEISAHADRVDVDALGNLTAYKAGSGPEPRLKVMLAAHMDEVGFMITKIDKNGGLRFHAVGGVEASIWPAKRVYIGDNRVPGVIGGPVPHLQRGDQASKPVEQDSLFIDIGATSDKDAESKVKLGDYGTFATQFKVLNEDPSWPTVRGKAFDDRAGCAAQIALLREQYPVDVVAVFTTQEEVGLRGARAAGYRVQPDAMLALEGTVCDDIPRAPDDDGSPVTRLGDGPALSLMDRAAIAHPGILRLLREAAQAEGIPFQYRQLTTGANDAGVVHLTRSGVPSGAISVPCRYIHSPAAILNLNDLGNAVRLAGAALRRIERAYLER